MLNTHNLDTFAQPVPEPETYDPETEAKALAVASL